VKLRSGIANSRVALIAALLTLAVAVAGCKGPFKDPEPKPDGPPTVAAVGGPIAFHIRLDGGQRLLTYTPAPDECPAMEAHVDLGSDGSVWLVAYATSCSGGHNERLGNGHHGVYRTTDDIPESLRSGATKVNTVLGTATTFEQGYYECTNSCKDFGEPVAVITLDHPADGGVQALTAYSPYGSIDVEDLSTFLRDRLQP
jgi:hypothetical protein